MGFSLRALCESRGCKGTSSIAPGTHPGEPQANLPGAPMRNSIETHRRHPVPRHRLYRIRGGRRRHAPSPSSDADARAAVAGRPGAQRSTTPACGWSKRPMSSALMRRGRPTRTSRRSSRQGGAGLQHARCKKFAKATELQPAHVPGLELRRLHQPQARQLRRRARGLRSRAVAQARICRGHRIPRPRLSRAQPPERSERGVPRVVSRAIASSPRTLLAAMQEWVGDASWQRRRASMAPCSSRSHRG